MNAATAIAILERVVRNVPLARRRSARDFHNAVDFSLVQLGWTVYREHLAPHHGLPRRGFIDLVVAAPLRVGIELDHTAPRKKSLLKLREFDGLKVIVLRNGWGNTAHRGDVVIIGCGGSGTTHFTR